MKYILSESRIMSTMMSYAKKHVPQITEPLKEKLKNMGTGNSGWGSSMHDYTIYILEYYAFDGNLVLIQYDRPSQSQYRWLLSESLETLYDFFGEELFEQFFLEIHNLDLKDKGNFDNNWVFGMEVFG